MVTALVVTLVVLVCLLVLGGLAWWVVTEADRRSRQERGRISAEEQMALWQVQQMGAAARERMRREANRPSGPDGW